MSPSSQLITDICRELGLICTITKAARERELNPNVWALYKTLDDVTYAYRNDDSDIIRREVVAIGRLSNLCLAVYAAKVWSANENERAGVLKAGVWRANGLYPKDLFWDDPKDRKFIKDKFRELAVEKAIRYSALLAGEGVEDDEDSMDDPTYDPTSTTPNARSTTGKRAVSSAQIKPDSWSCFSTTTDVEKGHQDASMLKELGVWLGSAEAPDEVLTELSFNEVIKDFYFATNCGTEKLENTEPKTNAHHWPNPSTTLACGACFHQGRATEEGMSTQDIKFQYKDMRRLLGTFPCRLNGRTVFAVLRPEMPRYKGSGVRSFWKVGGGYTNDVLVLSGSKERMVFKHNDALVSKAALASNPPYAFNNEQENIEVLSPVSANAEREPAQGSLSGPTALSGSRSPSGLSLARGHKRIDSNDSDDMPLSQRWQTQEHPGGSRQHTEQAGPTSAGSQSPQDRPSRHIVGLFGVPGFMEGPLNTIHSYGTDSNFIEQREHSADVPSTTASANSVSMLLQPNIALSNPLLTRTPRSSTKPSSTTSLHTPPATSALRLNIWFKLPSHHGRRVVSLSTSMTVQDAFHAVELAFESELQGRQAKRIDFTLPNEVFHEPVVVAGGMR